MKRLRRLIAFAFVLMSTSHARGDDWPMFGRSATRNSVSLEKNPPIWWQADERDNKGKLLRPGKNIKWSAALGSFQSRGEPIVANGLVWVGTDKGRLGKDIATALQCFRENDGEFLFEYVTKIPANDPLA